MQAYEIWIKKRINYYIKHVSCITNNIILHVRVELGVQPWLRKQLVNSLIMLNTIARFKWNEKQEIRKLQKQEPRNFFTHKTAELIPKYDLFWHEAPVET
jgi:hypothetical protein